MRRFLIILVVFGCGMGQSLLAQSFAITNVNPHLELYMYGNVEPQYSEEGRVPTFAYLGDDGGEDTRMSQDVVGWQTDSIIPINQTASHYLIRRCQVMLTCNGGGRFVYDPTHDSYRTYLFTNDPAYLTDADAGRPVELFGINYRNGYDILSFDQNSSFGNNVPGGRNAYPVTWSTNGAYVDVSNNIGKTNAAFPPFEAPPFAVGQFTNVNPGSLQTAGAKMFFNLDLNDPTVVTYLQNGLNAGRLNFSVSSLHFVNSMSGPGIYPDFATSYNQGVINPTVLILEVTLVRDMNMDDDSLPDDWEMFYFDNLAQGAHDDPDGDGMDNLAEYYAGTNPTQNNSVFRLATTSSPASKAVLDWPNLPSRKFTVEFSDDLRNWQTASNAAIAYPSHSTAEWTDFNPATTQRFYRIHATAQ